MSIKFSNGSKIEVTATTENAGIGKSCNCLIVDECATIGNNIMDAFWQAIYPVVSSSKESKVFLVSTPRGVGGLFYETYENARLGLDKSGWNAFRIDWWDVPGRDEEWKKQTIAGLKGDMKMFAREFGNMFEGSSYTLIPVDKIKQLKEFVLSDKWFEPNTIELEGGYSYSEWFKPIKGHCYIAGADVADGIGKDQSVILIFDVTNVRNVKQVASYYGQLSTIAFTYVLVKMAKKYNNAVIAIEANGIGRAVLDPLYSIYSYDNTLNYGGAREVGIMSTGPTKSAACRWLKDFLCITDITVELYEKNIITEMEYFERSESARFETYKAVGTKHDDFMMSFIWAIFCLTEENIETLFDVKEKIVTIYGTVLSVKLALNNFGAFDEVDPFIENNRPSDEDDIFRSLMDGKKISDVLPRKSEEASTEEYDESTYSASDTEESSSSFMVSDTDEFDDNDTSWLLR